MMQSVFCRHAASAAPAVVVSPIVGKGSGGVHLLISLHEDGIVAG